MRSRGQSAVELALTMPLLVFSLLGGAEMARAYAIQLAVQNGARAGAEASALDFTPTNGEAATHTQQEMNRTPGMSVSGNCTNQGSVYTCGQATITISRTQADGATACIQTPDPTTPCYFTVRVQYTFKTLVAWPFIPHSYPLDRSTKIRTYA